MPCRLRFQSQKALVAFILATMLIRVVLGAILIGVVPGAIMVHVISGCNFDSAIGRVDQQFADRTIGQSEFNFIPAGIGAIGFTGSDDATEISAEGMSLVTFYARNLAVPARRDVDTPEVLRGKDIFYTTGCTACHTPKFVTDRLVDQPEQSFQLIWPYTDMLLHDMGAGLADNRPEARATGREWRTPPLWGIGLTQTVSGHSYFLHDGRARSLLEAVLWHGGEAAPHRDRVIDLPTEERDALIAYLESL